MSIKNSKSLNCKIDPLASSSNMPKPQDCPCLDEACLCLILNIGGVCVTVWPLFVKSLLCYSN